MRNCDSGPVLNYLCGGGPVDSAPDGVSSMAPYVEIFFGDPKNPVIRVGNNASPSFNNTAVIKSFSYGQSTGAGIDVEILDVEGSAFEDFFAKLNKSVKNATNDFKMGARWGWVGTTCSGTRFEQIIDPPVILNPLRIETTFGEGKIKYIIGAYDFGQVTFNTKNRKIYGKNGVNNGDLVPLTVAINELAKEEPCGFEVEYLSLDKSGNYKPIIWQDGTEEGPKGIYSSDGSSKLATIQKWVEPFMTKNQRGVVLIWNAEKSMLTILEDPSSDCFDEQQCSKSGCLGKYIVNGGNCSNVLSFTPKISWLSSVSALLETGGGAGGALSGKSHDVNDDNDCDLDGESKDAGLATSVTTTEAARIIYGPKDAITEQLKAMRKHRKAQRLVEPMAASIEAELRLLGVPKPEFTFGNNFLGRYVSLAVINPFSLRENGASGCGEWLAQPPVNSTLSNKFWFIKGVNHHIQEGSYVTTLSLFLLAPGRDIP